jgi:hypothetical protein
MKEGFGEFKWTCFKDAKPELYKQIYFYDAFDGIGEVTIGLSGVCEHDDNCYWCYVYMPDPPKVEEKLTIEERLNKLEQIFHDITLDNNEFLKRIDALGIAMGLHLKR